MTQQPRTPSTEAAISKERAALRAAKIERMTARDQAAYIAAMIAQERADAVREYRDSLIRATPEPTPEARPDLPSKEAFVQALGEAILVNEDGELMQSLGELADALRAALSEKP